MAGSAKPPPHPIVDAAMPSSATRQARFMKTLRERHLLHGNNSSKVAKIGAAKGRWERVPASCVVVWTVMVDCAPELPGVTVAGEKVMVPPGSPIAVRVTGLVKLPLLDDTLML